MLRLAAVDAGAPAGELFYQHVVAVDALLTDWHGQKWVDLPGHLRAVRREGLLRFERATARLRSERRRALPVVEERAPAGVAGG